MGNDKMTNTRLGLLLGVATLLLGGCKKHMQDHPQIVTEDPVVNSVNSVEFKAEIKQIGDFAISDYGFVYSSNGYYGNSLDIGTGVKVSLGNAPTAGKYSRIVENVLENIYSNVIQVRSYITNSNGTVYGAVKIATLPVPSASSVAPMMGKVGDEITINGQFYTTNAEEVKVFFGNVATAAKSVERTKIVAQVPSGINARHNNTIEIGVQIGQQRYQASHGFTIQARVTDFAPKSGLIGSAVTLIGENLPYSYYYDNANFRLFFGDAQSTSAYYSETPIFYVPDNAKETSKVSVWVNNVQTELPGEFTLIKPVISSLSAQQALPGQPIDLIGTGLYGGTSNYPIVKLGNTVLEIYHVSEDRVTVYIPESVPSGTYALSYAIGPFNLTAAGAFKIVGPTASGFSPATGAINTAVTIAGQFLANRHYEVSFGSVRTGAYTASNPSNLQVHVPYGTPAGKHKVTIHFANGDVVLPGTFEVFGPEITSFSPTSGIPGSVVTITGRGFSPDTWSTKVRFGTVEATSITSLSETQIRVLVPSGATVGAMKINVESNGQIVTSKDDFTVKN